MMQRMSGRVSGLLDDLSDAISLLNDIMPSKASEQVLRSSSGSPQLLPTPLNVAGPVAWGLCPLIALHSIFSEGLR